MGVSCWNFLAAPKAVVIMETLIFFFLLRGCGGHTRVIVLASLFWTGTAVVIRGGSLRSDGRCYHSNPAELLLLATGETRPFDGWAVFPSFRNERHLEKSVCRKLGIILNATYLTRHW